jgi:hypothetical protein
MKLFPKHLGTHPQRSRRRRSVGILSSLVLVLGGTLIASGPAVSDTTPPWDIDGDIPGEVSTTPLDDPEGNVKELGPLNSNTTKIGVIHSDAVPTLGLTNPNANVDLRQAWLDTAQDGDGDDWLYFAWERDSNNGSGFIAYEFMHAAAPSSCNYSATNATLIANCNPWANRRGDVGPNDEQQTGDFIILWDQQGGSTDLYVRRWTGKAPNLTLGPLEDLDANVSAAAYGSNNFKGEAAINLTDAIFGGEKGCETFANAIPSTVTGNSDTADYKDTILKQITPIGNCGTLKVVKQTQGGVGAFDFTSNSLDPATFTLTTTAEGEAGEDVTTYSDLQAGTYDVSEDGEDGWDLTSESCDDEDGDDASSVTVTAGETVTCTFVNTLQQGALKILKQSTKTGNPLVANAGAVFTYDDGVADPVSVTDGGSDDEDTTTGEVCVSGLAPGSYTVNETSPPSGYADADASQADQTFTVVAGTDCGDNEPADADAATFTNAPLADIQVNYKDGGSGETSVTSITCDDAGTETTTAPTGWDDSITHSGIAIDPSPQTINCTIVIDP